MWAQIQQIWGGPPNTTGGPGGVKKEREVLGGAGAQEKRGERLLGFFFKTLFKFVHFFPKFLFVPKNP